ncbi:MAG: Ig-like domain-containing protein, partial [Oscillospiraceae bacterium]|nr:Ig-like domain-containing protein [Oscillospiraceae bacterium]
KITAKSSNGKTATCKVTVKPKVAVTAVKLNKSSASVVKGKTVTLKATISPTNATDKTITWSSSNKAIATVTAKGVVKGIKAGTVKITAKSSNGKTATCKVTVKNPEVLVKYKTISDVYYRTKPSMASNTKQGAFAKGVTVSVVKGYAKTADGIKWYKIKKSGKYYYVAAKYLKKV